MNTLQYKNFKSFSNIVYHYKDFQIVAIWTFFATAHGKSSCDGIGGNIKRCAANESLRRSPHEAIVCAADMFEFCTKTFPSIVIQTITAQDISTATQIVEKREMLSKTLDGTQGYHYFEHVSNGKIGTKILSTDEHFELKIDHIPISNNSINDFFTW